MESLHPYIISSSSVTGVRLDVKPGEIKTDPQTSLQLCRLPLRLERGQGQTHPRALADSKCKDIEMILLTNLSGLEAYIPDRVTHSYGKASPPWSTPYEGDTMTLEKQIEGYQSH